MRRAGAMPRPGVVTSIEVEERHFEEIDRRGHGRIFRARRLAPDPHAAGANVEEVESYLLAARRFRGRRRARPQRNKECRALGCVS